MYRRIIRCGIVSALLTIFFSYGVLVGVYKIFPHSQILAFKQFLMPNPSSIGRNKEYRIELFEKFSPSAEVVFIGDSITEGGEWTEFFPNLKVSNRGVGSDKTSDVLKRIDSIISVTPNTAFIMLGINDISGEIAID
jgi:lysophospholipase L1-like esterase